MKPIEIDSFISRQLDSWPEAAERYRALQDVKVKEVTAFGATMRVQFNPARAVSTAAKVDPAAVAARPCFLCEANRPACQIGIGIDDFILLLNPFPIFPNHLVIASRSHTPQSLRGHTGHMRSISRMLPGYTLIFNGARSGASAPDHMHFQAVPSRHVTLPEWCFSYELPEGTEPENDEMINAYCTDGRIRIIPRKAHRPKCYGEIIVSPASLDLAGTLITVRDEDFARIDTPTLERILGEVTYLQPEVMVGITECTTPRVTPLPDGLTEVEGITIGSGFHWQRRMTQRFAGTVELQPLPGGLTRVVNRVNVEEYLRSVIASEMNATSSVELLKAHAVISRSWLMAQLRMTRALACKGTPVDEPADDTGATIRWYDRDDHTDFDVCADDHCQRYQGAGRASTPQVDEAIAATRGLVLTDAGGRIADTRFSKCCGGVTELFQNCWQPNAHSYLQAIVDAPGHPAMPDLTTDEGVARWIASSPQCHCNTSDPTVLRQVLNDFDIDTTPDFFRWEQRHSADELSALVCRRSGIDFGTVTDLRPLHRGPSGRITRLLIAGTRRSMVVGKELEIRRWLSDSHLRSSAFTVSREADGSFTLRGAGWGHGVGLCQIGAAVMACRGCDFKTILSHYFPDTKLTRLYR